MRNSSEIVGNGSIEQQNAGFNSEEFGFSVEKTRRGFNNELPVDNNLEKEARTELEVVQDLQPVFEQKEKDESMNAVIDDALVADDVLGKKKIGKKTIQVISDIRKKYGSDPYEMNELLAMMSEKAKKI